MRAATGALLPNVSRYTREVNVLTVHFFITDVVYSELQFRLIRTCDQISHLYEEMTPSQNFHLLPPKILLSLQYRLYDKNYVEDISFTVLGGAFSTNGTHLASLNKRKSYLDN